ncbi:hypothetical protein NDA11_004161 [Ustilago hordei]|uniref:Reverse transcriptase Ty1/copia-type domain-containing protein n=1 Tax=Ustilago hordei TaxID=120017 RepID=I2FMG1_USTHO|nr:hypothetical protein NDA12_005073 [Ustilago hordei]KAJ1588927.1 hypothetical protein NDA15_000564 [Ustilago hordei]KAJ1590935.1 hypothetical protein NDA11_004161 [Ustilago hordei]KAJ1600548.1 hypothetical protein NDA14_001238 [Ustilago hordei]CCF48104.1 uncharacterized protein UHOR_12773 [Ustilago hordei]
MEITLGLDKHYGTKTWIDDKAFGLVAMDVKAGINLDPTIQEALAGENRGLWEEARQKELDGLEAMSMWEVTDLPPVQDWEADSIDVKQAYLNLNLHHNIYLKPPISTKVHPGKVFKLIKGLYGLKQSGQEWNIKLDSHLRRIGFYCMLSAPCLYMRGTGNSITVIMAYMDDMLIALPSCREVDHTKHEIMNKWGTEDNSPIKEFLGIKIIWDRSKRSMSLDLAAYVKAVIGARCAGGRKKLKSYEGAQESQDWAKRELKEEFTEISSRNDPMA